MRCCWRGRRKKQSIQFLHFPNSDAITPMWSCDEENRPQPGSNLDTAEISLRNSKYVFIVRLRFSRHRLSKLKKKQLFHFSFPHWTTDNSKTLRLEIIYILHNPVKANYFRSFKTQLVVSRVLSQVPFTESGTRLLLFPLLHRPILTWTNWQSTVNLKFSSINLLVARRSNVRRLLRWWIGRWGVSSEGNIPHARCQHLRLKYYRNS